MGTSENPRNGKEREMTDAIIQQQRRRERKKAKWRAQRVAEDASMNLSPAPNDKTGKIRRGICPGTEANRPGIGKSPSAKTESAEERGREWP